MNWDKYRETANDREACLADLLMALADLGEMLESNINDRLTTTFTAEDPVTGEVIPLACPVSGDPTLPLASQKEPTPATIEETTEEVTIRLPAFAEAPSEIRVNGTLFDVVTWESGEEGVLVVATKRKSQPTVKLGKSEWVRCSVCDTRSQTIYSKTACPRCGAAIELPRDANT